MLTLTVKKKKKMYNCITLNKLYFKKQKHKNKYKKNKKQTRREQND